MQHPMRVGECHGVTNAKEEPKAFRDGRDGLNVLVEPLALDKFHRIENPAITERSHVVNGHDARMFEPREHQRFTNQAVCEIAVRAGHVQNFKRNATLQSFIFGGIHHAHAAARHALQQAVARSGEIRDLGGFAQMLDRFVGKKLHFGSVPNAARASRWNSSSLPQSSRKRSSAILRKSRRTQARALVTSVTEMAYSFANCS